jgi:acyl dehydratase
MVDAFAEVGGDHQWIHVDVERAAAGPFGRTIAHGYLTLSLIPHLVSDVYELRGGRMRLNYGLDRVRFPHPAPVGTRIRAVVEFDELTDTPAGRRLATAVTVEGEGLPKPVCVARTLTLIVS